METLFDVCLLMGFVSVLAFLPLQIYAGIRCRGVWRIMALLPILLMFPVIAFIDYVFAEEFEKSNLLGLVVVLCTAPVGAGYLIVLLIIRRKVQSRDIEWVPSNKSSAGELPPSGPAS